MSSRKGLRKVKPNNQNSKPQTEQSSEKQNSWSRTLALKRWDKIRQSIRGGFKPELLLHNKDLKGFKLAEVVNEIWEALEVGSETVQRPHARLLASLGLGRMSLDAVNMQKSVSATLFELSRLIKVAVERDSVDMFLQETEMERTWKVLLLGLVQSDKAHRKLALLALGEAIPYCAATLRDGALCELVFEMLLGIANTRKESPRIRSLAVYFLGNFAANYVHDTSQQSLVSRIFDELVVLLQWTLFVDENADLSVVVLAALGKLLESVSGDKLASVLYLAHAMISRNVVNNPWVVHAVLSVLNNDVPQECEGLSVRDYVGALFKPFVKTWLHTELFHIQRLAVQFLEMWLPLHSDQARLEGLRMLTVGLQYLHNHWLTSLSDRAYKQAMSSLEAEQQEEQLETSLRLLYQRQLLAAPGTRIVLQNLSGAGNFFGASAESTLLGTSCLLLQLPVHPSSLLVVERPLPPLQGVPDNATTVPPVYVDLQSTHFRAFAGTSEPLEDKIDVTSETQAAYMPFGYRWVSNEISTAVEASRSVPLGFTSPCPYPSADSSTGLGTSNQKRRSSVASHVAVRNANIPGISALPDLRPNAAFLVSNPEQSNNVPIAWTQPEAAFLKPVDPSQRTDFPLHAPVVIEVIEPPEFKNIRITCIVRSVDSPMAPIEIQNETCNFLGDSHASTAGASLSGESSLGDEANGNEEEPQDDQMQHLGPAKTSYEVGTLLSMYVRRAQSHKWSLVTLEIKALDKVDLMTGRSASLDKTAADFERLPNASFAENASNDQQLSPMQRRMSYLPGANAVAMETHYSSVVSQPVAAGTDNLGNPFYALPVNPPAIPTSYSSEGVALYARNPKLIAPPVFQNSSGPLVLAGFDFSGKPFFVPPGCVLPTPTGFSPAGLPYYDLATLVNLRGHLLYKMPLSPIQGKLSSQVQRHIQLLQAHESTAKHRFGDNGTKKPQTGGFIETCSSLKNYDGVLRSSDKVRQCLELLHAPQNVQRLFQKTEQLLFLMPFPMKIALDPQNLSFSSVQAPQVLNATIKFKAARGDHSERDIFVIASPMRIFSIKKHCYRVQGEGILEFQVTFNPDKVQQDKNETIFGTLTVADEYGQRLSCCHLQAVRQSSFELSPEELDVGFVLPEQSKFASFKLDNTSNKLLHLDLSLESELIGYVNVAAADKSAEAPKKILKAAFLLDSKTVKLHPKECKAIRVGFEPSTLGVFRDTLQVRGPGGDVHKMTLVGISGVPIAVFPESQQSSNLGSAALSRIRCGFMKRQSTFESSAAKAKKAPGLAFFHADGDSVLKGESSALDEAALLKSLMAVVLEGDRKKAQTLDFGIVAFGDAYRCVSLINLSSKPIVVSLFAHSPLIECPSLVRIPPRLVVTVDIVLRFPESVTTEGYNFNSLIELVCPEFGNIPLHMKAFIGQPLYFLSWDNAFFRPCVTGSERSLELLLINQSQYALPSALSGLDATMSCTGLSTSTDKLTSIASFSCTNVKLHFRPTSRGPVLSAVNLQVQYPGTSNLNKTNELADDSLKASSQASVPLLTLNAAMMNRNLRFIGIGLHPPGIGSQQLNNLEFLRAWLSHPKRLIDEYPAQAADRERLFGKEPADLDSAAADDNAKANEVGFTKDSFKLTGFLSNSGSSAHGAMLGMRKSQFTSVQIVNSLDTSVNATLLTSTCFNADPRGKTLPPKAPGQIDLSYIAPPECPDCVPIYGFGAVFNEKTGKVHSAQILGRNFADVFLVPSVKFESAPQELNKTQTSVLPGASVQRMVLDFGKLHVTSQAIEPAVLYLHLVNQGQSLYSWNLKGLLASSSNKATSKYTGFDVGLTLGEIQPQEMVTLPVKFTATTVGTFETSLELLCKESLDRQAVQLKHAVIVLRGSIVSTVLAGLPDDIVDFGSTVVIKQQKRCNWSLTNVGSSSLRLQLIAKPPFAFQPSACVVEPKKSYDVSLLYEQKESRVSHSLLYIFANSVLYSVPVTGTAGTALFELDPPRLRFDAAREDTISYASVFLTNRGSLPLKLQGIISNAPNRITLEYINLSATHASGDVHPVKAGLERKLEGDSAGASAIVRNDAQASTGETSVYTKLDRWRFLKRMLILIVRNASYFRTAATVSKDVSKKLFFGHISHEMVKSTASRGARAASYSRKIGVLQHIISRKQYVGALLTADHESVIPEVKPSMTVEFRLGFLNTYSVHQHVDLEFKYAPVIDSNMMDPAAFASVCDELVQSVKLDVVGSVYRPLMFFPIAHNFGLSSAEHYLPTGKAATAGAEQLSVAACLGESQIKRSDSGFSSELDEPVLRVDGYGVVQRSFARNVRTLQVTNYSWESQTFQLVALSPTFATPIRSWFIGAGETVRIPIRFHPLKEQTRYQGEALFQHKHGYMSVSLCGTGASADIEASPEKLDFGSLRLNAESLQTVTISNRGLLSGKFSLEILQRGSELSFVDPQQDPGEYQGTLAPGASVQIPVRLKCTSTDLSDALLCLMSQRVPDGVWEEQIIPFCVQIGHPMFTLDSLELDFGTIFIGSETTLYLEASNEGNARCHFAVKIDTPLLLMEPTSGLLEPGQRQVFKVTYTPVDFKSLQVSVPFTTDAGFTAVVCYGAVGVPYLQIPDGLLDLDFGLVSIHQPASRQIPITNTGLKRLEFSIEFDKWMLDKAPCDALGKGLSPPIQIQPMSGWIGPKETLALQVMAAPDILASEFSVHYIIKTTQGERLTGRIQATGGSAILKMCFADALASGSFTCKPLESSEATPVNLPALPDSVDLASESYLDTVGELSRHLKFCEYVYDMKSKSEATDAVDTAIPATDEQPVEVDVQVTVPPEDSTDEPLLPVDDAVADDKDSADESDDEPLAFTEVGNASRRRRSSILGGNTDRRASMANTVVAFNEGTGTRRRRSSLIGADDAEPSLTSLIPYIHQGAHLAVLESTNELSGASETNLKGIFGEQVAKSTEALAQNFAGTELFGELHSLIKAHRESGVSVFSTVAQSSDDQEYSVSSNRTAQQKAFVLETKSFLKAIREQLLAVDGGNERTVELLKKLQHAAATLEQILFSMGAGVEPASGESRAVSVNSYSDVNLGFIRGVEGQSEQVLDVLTLSNFGNMAFACAIEDIDDQTTSNLLVDAGTGVASGILRLSPTAIVIAPGQSVTVQAQFVGSADGTYAKAIVLVHDMVKIITMRVRFQVGNAVIVCDTESVDFGLVGKNRTVFRSIELRNTGSFGDSVKLRPVQLLGSSSFKATVFRARPSAFDLAPNESQVVQLSCIPYAADEFKELWQILWSSNPLSLELFVKGGAPLLRPTFLEPGDVSFGGFDFKNAVVDRRYTRQFKLCNYGNIGSTFSIQVHEFFSVKCLSKDLSSTEPALEPATSDVPLSDEHAPQVEDANATAYAPQVEDANTTAYAPLQSFSLDVDEEQLFELELLPKFSCTLNESLVFKESDIPDAVVASIPLYAKCGISKGVVDGRLQLKNIKAGSSCSSEISFVNVGDLDVPLWTELVIDTAETDPDYAVAKEALALELSNDFPQSGNVPPGESIRIRLVAHPTAAATMCGRVIVRSEFGSGPAEFVQEFRLKSFDKEFVIDQTSDVSLGRIVVGEEMQVKRTVYNFGSNALKYRTLLEAVDSEESGEASWAIDNGSGSIDAESNQVITFTFTAPGVSGTLTACKATVQYFSEDSWHSVAAFRLSGGSGIPLLDVVVPPECVLEAPGTVVFGNCPVNCEKRVVVKCCNRGNASTLFRVPEFSDPNFAVISCIGPANDRLDANEEVLLTVSFKASAVALYEASWIPQVSAGVQFSGIRFCAQGAAYSLDASQLPKSIDFDRVVLGSANCVVPFTLTNGSAFDTELVYTIQPVQTIANSTIELVQRPMKLCIPANGSSEYKLVFKVPVPEDELGRIEGAKLGSVLSLSAGTKAVLQLAFSHDPTTVQYEIPITAKQFCVEPLLVTADAVSNVAVDKAFDLGSFRLETGGAKDLYIVNNNNFALQIAVRLERECDPESLLYVNGSLFDVLANSAVAVPVGILRYPDSRSGKEMPQRAELKAKLCWSFRDLDKWLQPGSVDLRAVLMEDALDLQVDKSHDFDICYIDSATEWALEFLNPLKRTLQYKLVKDSGSKADTSFTVDSNELLDDNGLSCSLAARAQGRHVVSFRPKTAGVKACDLHIETFSGTFTVSLRGSAIAPTVVCEHEELDFGVIGMKEPEFRLVGLSNPSPIKIQVAVSVEGRAFSVPGIGTDILTIDANEQEFIKVHYNPSEADQTDEAVLAIEDRSTLARTVLARCVLRGTGGHLKFTAAVSAAKAATDEVAVSLVPPKDEAQVTVVADDASVPTAKPEALFSEESAAVFAEAERPLVAEVSSEPIEGAEAPVTVVNMLGGELPLTQTVELPKLDIPSNSKVVQLVEIENTGTTTLDLQVQNAHGIPLDDKDQYLTNNERLLVQVEPSAAVVLPSSKQVFTVSIDSLAKTGTEQASIVIATTSLVEPRSITLEIETHVSMSSLSSDVKSRPSSRGAIRSLATAVVLTDSSLSAKVYAEASIEEEGARVAETSDEQFEKYFLDIEKERDRVRRYLDQKRLQMRNHPQEPVWLTSLQTFVRNDTSVEHVTDVTQPTSQLLCDEYDLWKVLLPLVRVSGALPSQELQHIPMKEPNLVPEKLHSLLVLPPPLATDIAENRAQRFYSQRAFLKLEKRDDADHLALDKNSASLYSVFAAQPSALTPSQERDIERKVLAEDFVRKLERRVQLEPKKKRF